MSEIDPPRAASVVIIGGGVAGCSVAYHLAALGWRDVVLLERKQLTCGTTWHAAGLAVRFKGSPTLAHFADYTVSLYERLAEQTDRGSGVKRNGSLTVAASDHRREELLRGVSAARGYGLAVELVAPEEMRELWPLMDPAGLTLGAYLPDDAQVSPIDVTLTLAAAARAQGARILEGVAVTGFEKTGDRISAVKTSRGTIAAEVVVNCGGMWAREIGAMAGAVTPLHACEHSYVVTEEIRDLPATMPILRDLDGEAYFKEDAGKLLIGAFEEQGVPWGGAGIPDDFCFDELPPNFDQIAPVLEGAFRRIPVLETTGIRTFFNGPESFTPDGAFLLGPTKETPNLFVAAGFNSNGVGMGGGVGWAIAHWIQDGTPPIDVAAHDIRRVLPFEADLGYLADRAAETLGESYAVHWPYRQRQARRNLLLSPLHSRLEAAGAFFEQAAGHERPRWFARSPADRAAVDSFGRASWWGAAAEEHAAVRERAALFDLSSFAQIEVSGPGALDALQWLCGADVDVPLGRLVYTQWLNDRGGIEADVTVMRLAEALFWVVSGAGSAARNAHWLAQSVVGAEGVALRDLSAQTALLSLQGPESRAILEALGAGDLPTGAFPFGAVRALEVAGVPVRAARVSYVGELGYELYAPAAAAPALFDALLGAGRPAGLRLAGMQALGSCRIEKAFREWGHDITDQETPLEAGLGFACKLRTDIPFRGRAALEAQKAAGVRRRLVQFLLGDPEPLMFHNEPIYRSGALCGLTTSAGYGHTLGASVALGYVAADEAVGRAYVEAGAYEIEVAGRRYPARASLAPLYDPKSLRMRA